jgi:hypothetical protein
MSHDPMETILHVRVPDRLKRWLERRGRVELTTASGLVRRVLREYMARVDREAYNEMSAELAEQGEADGKP